MGELIIGNILQELDGRFDEGLTVDELIGKGATKKTLVRMYQDGLIAVPDTQAASFKQLIYGGHDEKLYANMGNIRYHLSLEGYELLNQIRMKKAVENLTSTITTLDKANHQTAKRILWLTVAVVVIGAIQIALFYFNLHK